MGIRVPLFRRSGHASSATQPESAQEFLQQAGKLVHRLFAPPGQPAPSSVMFCGIDRGSGCSTLSCRTAEILAAKMRGTVILVDANLAAPSLHRHFQLENRQGFSDALVSSEPMHNLAKQIKGSNLWVLTNGTVPDVSLTAYTERLHSQILALRTLFNYVLVDVPPLNVSWDAIMLGQSVEGAVLVIEAKSASREAARHVKEALKAANIRILGAVLNKWATSPAPKSSTAADAPAQPAQAAKKDKPREAQKPATENPKKVVTEKVAIEKAVTEKPVSREQPAAREAARTEPARPDKATNPPEISGNAHVKAQVTKPMERKMPPSNALTKTLRSEIPKKRGKRRLWRKFLWRFAAARAERAVSMARESSREAAVRPTLRNDLGRRPGPQGVWNKPAAPARATSRAETLTSIPRPAASPEPSKSTNGRDASPKPNQADPRSAPIELRPASPAPKGRNGSSGKKPDELAPAAAEDAGRKESAAWLLQNAARPASAWRSKILVATLWTMAVGASLWMVRARGVSQSNYRRPEIHEALPMTVSNPLGLQVDRTGAILDILWDRTSATAVNSNGGAVTIRDGDQVKRVGLDPREIRTGHLYYRPRNADLDIRLEVAVENGGTATESVRLVGAPAPGGRRSNL